MRIISIAAAALLIFAAASYAKVVDKIAVVVNAEVITQGEIESMMQPIYQQYSVVYSKDELAAKTEEARQNITEQLIDEKLLLSEAKRQNIEVTEGEVDERVDETKKRFDSIGDFDAALAEQDLTLSELRQRYKEQLMTKKLIDSRIGSKINITPIEVANYYKKHADEFVQPEEIKLRNILIRLKEDVPVTERLALAKDILRRIHDGGDFAALAIGYSEGPGASDGGLMGYVKKGDLLPEIENVVFAMNEGEVSDIVQTSFGYHIFKVEEKRPEKQMGLSEVRRDVEDAIYRMKIKDKMKGLVQELKKNAYIEFK